MPPSNERRTSSDFLKEDGDWTDYRQRFGLRKGDEIDLHFGKRDPAMSYYEAMSQIPTIVRDALKQAQAAGRPYIMFVHGSSTSGPGKTTARSQVRQFMRSKFATPFIVRRLCIEHETVFIARIRL